MLLVLMPQLPRCCETRKKLAEEFATSTRIFAEVAMNLCLEFDSQKYAQLLVRLQQAQHRAEEAASNFEEHVELHRIAKSAAS